MARDGMQRGEVLTIGARLQSQFHRGPLRFSSDGSGFDLDLVEVASSRHTHDLDPQHHSAPLHQPLAKMEPSSTAGAALLVSLPLTAAMDAKTWGGPSQPQMPRTLRQAFVACLRRSPLLMRFVSAHRQRCLLLQYERTAPRWCGKKKSGQKWDRSRVNIIY